jgi:flavin-dependent dehydrogenase
VVPVNLKDSVDSETCWIESLEEGWLFLIPNGPESAWLLSVGAPADSLLGHSRLISERITSSSGASREFPACPRIMSPLCGPEWLACGTAAMAFDPICGDGTANAVREAILASAVTRAIGAGGNVTELLAHYETRLIAGFYRHLLLCRQFYESGHKGLWWESELKALDRGLEWCARKAGAARQFRYQLNGFELQAVS